MAKEKRPRIKKEEKIIKKTHTPITPPSHEKGNMKPRTITPYDPNKQKNDTY